MIVKASPATAAAVQKVAALPPGGMAVPFRQLLPFYFSGEALETVSIL
jgi:hypothetical protein